MPEHRIEPLFNSVRHQCDIRGCAGVAEWTYVLDGDRIRLCTRHWEVIEEGPIPDAE